MKKLLLFFLISYTTHIVAQLPAVVTCWTINTDSTGFAGILTNAQAVQYDAANVYISTTDIASWIPVSYNWPNNPWLPQNQGFIFTLPRNPQPNTDTPLATPFGHIGIWKNGVSIYNTEDTKSFNDSNVWMQNAFFFEHIQLQTMDECLGHPNDHHEYHTHTTPACLYNESDSTAHAPLLGYAFDGYPIYGAYGYISATSPGLVKRMKSSYRVRNMATRDTLPNGTVLAPVYYGPRLDSIPLGAYVQDFEYVPGLGDLDEHNGRTCVTPEYPQGTYAYFATLDSNLVPVFPYTIGTTFYGIIRPNAGDLGPNSGHPSVPDSVTTYVPLNAGISETTTGLSLSVFPNPTSDQLNFRMITANIYQKFTGTIYNQLGEVIESSEVIPGKWYTYNAGALAAGVYYLKVAGGRQWYSSKFVVQK